MSRKTLRRRAVRKARSWFPRRRRGMVLLVVLSMLAIFTLITVSFVLIASQGRRTAVAAARADRTNNTPQSQLHEAMLQIIRGTQNPLSVLQTHSLLEDMYGNDAVTGMITDNFPQPVTNVTTSGVIQLANVEFDQQFNQPVPTGNQPNNPKDPFAMSARLYRSGYFSGCVITMTSGPLAGKSARIVDYEPNVVNPTTLIGQLQITSFGGNQFPQQRDRFVINGRPFNGAGFGMENFAAPSGAVTVRPNAAGFPGPLLTYSDGDLLGAYPGTSWPRALLPNPIFGARDGSYHAASADATMQFLYDPAGPGGADEAYDAADFQNLHLAMHYWDTTANMMITRLPSFHRPDLINWWSQQLPVSNPQKLDFRSDTDAASVISKMQTEPHVWRKAMMRPTPFDHPNFPGNDTNTGPGFHPLWGYGTANNPEWDVDNDGDGKRDSVWVDMGMPAQPSADGRWFKPMFAVLCVDMDGRLNLNAHGNPNHLDLAAYQSGTGATPLYGPIPSGTAGALQPGEFSFGQGYGPAEVNLRRALPVVNGVDSYLTLLEGRLVNGQRFEGRYGEAQGAAAISNNNIPRPGYTDDTFRAADAYNVLANNMRLTATNLDQMQMPRNYAVDAFSPLASRTNWMVDGFGSSPDLDGDGVLVLDYRGNPYLASVTSVAGRGVHGAGEIGEMFNDPYELDLSHRSNKWVMQGSGAYPAISPIDAAFTPDELERILRRYDADADYVTNGSASPAVQMNNTRLTSLIQEAMYNNPRFNTLFTTESWDVPAAGAMVVIDNVALRSVPPAPPTNVAAPYKVRRVQNQSIQDLLVARLGASVNVNVALRELLPPEVLAGRKMDLNSPFGNGRDDNGNGVIDEPSETLLETVVGPDRSFANPNRPPKFAWLDADNDGVNIASNTDASSPRGNDPDELNARMEYAKHLYVLMMLLVDNQFYTTDGWNDTTGANTKLEVARRIAQWVVNVVDFRDRDSIMTGFEFDLDPFTDDVPDPNNNPWDVDGDLTTDEGANIREIAWGCERPELLITETISTHERRTADESVGGLRSDNPADPHYDQMARPRGTVAFELFNPGGHFEAPAPEVHGIVGANDFGIDLGAFSKPDSGGRMSPVWRVVTHKPRLDAGNDPDEFKDPDRVHYRPILADSDIGKIAYFTVESSSNPNVIEPPHTGQPKFHRDNDLPAPEVIRPGSYALVAPAGPCDDQNRPNTNGPYYRTYFGERSTANDAGGKKNTYPFHLQLASPDGRIGPFRGTTFELPTAAKSVIGVVIEPRVVGNNVARFSVSEPDAGYSTLTPVTMAPRSVNQFHPDDFFSAPEDVPIGATQLERNDYVPEGKSMLYLERLADPTRPWNQLTNPYLTIDRAPLDLRSFRGEPVVANAGTEGTAPVADTAHFDSFRRGLMRGANQRAGVRNVWSSWGTPEIHSAPEMNGATGTSNPLTKSTFGHLNGFSTQNEEYGPVFQANAAETNPATSTPSTPKSTYDGDMFVDPARPAKPWLTWNNRPFVSPVELLLVPGTSPAGLLMDHATREASFDPYAPSTVDPLDNSPNAAFRDSFRHLLNFFNSASPAPGRARGKAPELYRLFDFVEVPSRFAGTYDMLDPAEFSGGNNHYFHPPYNKVSRYREPGKINLNTVYDPAVFEALMDGVFSYAPTGSRWADFVQSRRGYSFSADIGHMSNAHPTVFANPFRPAGAFPFVPTDGLMTLNVKNQPINVTIMRQQPSGPGGSASNEPLFAAPILSTPLPHNDPERNPYFYYAGMQKIYNSVTTRSNVYAVWVTVGYFEVTPVPIDPTRYPDGWQLGAELGTDTGEIERHRAFYLYDRTIPVGFQRGETLNVEDGLLIRRYIE
ncbi:MAG: hypothetical protein SGJ19_11550 [Planctomycetia bacterium]|nr:hypothetical protein [Planctomycetia bacterium]